MQRLRLRSRVSVVVLISLALPASDVTVVRFVRLYGPEGIKGRFKAFADSAVTCPHHLAEPQVSSA